MKKETSKLRARPGKKENVSQKLPDRSQGDSLKPDISNPGMGASRQTEESLRVSEENFRSIFENNSAAMALIEKDTTVSMVNDEYCKMSGYIKEEVEGMSWTRQIPPQDLERLMEYNRIRLSNPKGAPDKYEFSFYKKNGEIRDAIMSIAMLQNGKLISSFIDITERKHIEEKLKQNELELKKRIKELNGIYSLALLIERLDTCEEVYREFVKVIVPESMKFPDKVFVSLRIDDEEYSNFENFKPRTDCNCLSAPINLWGKLSGELLVCYTENLPFIQSFEQSLIYNFADRISKYTERKRAEDDLQASEGRYHDLIEQVRDIIFSLSPEGILVSLNYSFESHTAWHIHEWIGRSIFDLVHPADVSLATYRLTNILKGDTSRAIELRIRKKSGDYLLCEVLATPQLKQDTIIGLLGIARDITERRRSEEALLERDNRFAKLSSQVPGLIFQFVKKTDGTYCVPFATEAIRDIFGCSPQDVYDDFSPIASVILPEDMEKVMSSIEYSGRNLSIWKCEYRVRIPGEQVRWMFGQSTPEKLDDDSIIWHGFNSDITARKQSEMMLRKLNRTYALLSEINRTIIRVHKPQELYEAVCNIAIGEGGFRMAWIGLLDPRTKNVVPVAWAGKTEKYLDRLHITLDDSERGRGPTASALRIGKHHVANDIATDSRMSPWRDDALKLGFRASAVFPFSIAGELRGALTLYASETNFFDDEELTLLDEMAANISFAMGYAEEEEQRKRAEGELRIAKDKAEESDRLKSTFLANMSHEIRTPMNAIVGFAGMLSDPELSYDDRQRFTDIIQSRSDDLMHLINDLLDISRIESGNATVVKTVVSLNDILDEMEAVFRQKTEKNNITDIVITAEKKLPRRQAIIRTDGFILKQVFSNLIDNAIKFTETGSIRFGYNIPEEGMLSCYVTDTGIGISPENQKIIFEHFRQAVLQNPKKLYGGTGLGLSICKGSLALLGGKIWVESTPGEGSTFRFSFPFEQERETSQDPASGKGIVATEDIYNWSGKKFLLVEDEQSNMDYLNIILKQTGADLTSVYSGKELRAQFENIALFDLVLLDVRLPDASGWELAKEIKRLRPGLPVISQTAYAMSTDREKSKEAGCEGYISKPILKKELYKIIASLVFPKKASG